MGGEHVGEWSVPGYTELKPVGAGGFGTVMLGTHDATGTPVAIKHLRADLLADPGFVTMFRAEAVTLSSLDNPYVVRLYEYVEAPAGAAIVMELVDGVSLAQILRNQGKTTAEAALVVLYGSLLGLAASHARGVVHRDYKPGNVLVNGYGASKLADFGIAERSGTRAPAVGTLAYAPPEQFDGSPASPASDVYAAVATFYECLTGHPPFTGQTAETLIDQHRHADVPLDEVPAPLQRLIARGMAKDPRYRPADAAALAAELRTAAAGAYGPDWETRGRSHLGEAALLLVLLWPSAGMPALTGSTVEQVRLSQSVQAARPAQAPHGATSHANHPVSAAARHHWHLLHVLHLEHLAHERNLRRLRNAAVAGTAAVVVAAGVTVATTGGSHSPGGSGSAGHPAVAAFPVPLETIPLTAASGNPVVTDDVYVTYHGGRDSSAGLKGTVPSPAAGEVVRLYAQQFPFTSAPVLAGTSTVNPEGGSAAYAFSVTPTLATHYQVELFSSATATTPVATSVSTTIYVVADSAWDVDHCSARPFCRGQYVGTVYVPPAAMSVELNKQWYVYIGVALAPPGTNPPPPAWNLLANGSPPLANGTATVSAPRQTSADTYTVTINDSYQWGDHAPTTLYWTACDKDTEAQDGLGLPGSHGCGAQRVANGNEYLGGNPNPN